jgi:hypothetical protein
MHPDCQHFLRFSHEGKVYQFQALPFGLASAPLIFTTVVKAFVAPFHALGLKLHFYLDDWLLRCQCRATLRRQLTLLLQRVHPPGRMGGEWRLVLAGSISGFRLRRSQISHSGGTHVTSPGPDRQDPGSGATVAPPHECFSQGVSSSLGAAQLGGRSSAFGPPAHAPAPLTVAPPLGPTGPVSPGPGDLLG